MYILRTVSTCKDFSIHKKNNKKIGIYFAQLRHLQDNTDLFFDTSPNDALFIQKTYFTEFRHRQDNPECIKNKSVMS